MNNTPSLSEPATVDLSSERLPEQIGRYRIQKRIGSGGMGTVYLAEDPQLQRIVAVKVPKLDIPESDRELAIQRFLREARAAAQIRHAHVCPIYDVGQQDGRPYVVMANVTGGTLADRLQGAKRFDDSRAAIHLISQVADALAAIHSHGIIHRDLKPGNILIDASGQALLTDFGLARPTGDTENLTYDGAIIGTPAYMAPEQASAQTSQIGPWTDIYSLGVVLYQMLTGSLPFQGSFLEILAKIRTESPAVPSSVRPDLDPQLEKLVLRCMDRQPENRYRNADELSRDIESWQNQGSISPTVNIIQKRRRKAIPIAIAMALFVGLGFAVWSWNWSKDRGNPDIGKEPNQQTTASNVNLDDPDNRDRRPPTRVSITYDVEANGAMQKVELPFVIGVLGDFSGHNKTPLPPMKDRRFREIDISTFDQLINVIEPRVVLDLPRRSDGVPRPAIELVFRKLSDFDPDGVVGQIPALKTLADDRAKKHGSDSAADKHRVADIDRELSVEMAAILHHPEFQRLEAAWRGLRILVLQQYQYVTIKFLNVQKQELLRDVSRATAYDHTTLFKKVYEEQYGTLGGRPMGLLIGDFEIDCNLDDIRLLKGLTEVMSRFHAPFVASANQRMLRFSLSPELAEATAGPALAEWQAFRTSESSRYAGLTLPRVLARLPYGRQDNRVNAFEFDELIDGSSHDKFLWMNASWAFADRVANALSSWGWPVRIRGQDGGKIEWLPTFQFAATGSNRFTGSLEIALTEKRAAELSNLGFLPLRQYQAVPMFIGSQSCHEPIVVQDSASMDATGAGFSSRLDAVLCAFRFALYAQVMASYKVGSIMEASDCERWLNDWLSHFVLGNPDNATDVEKLQRPLQEARVAIRPQPGKPGWYEMTLLLRPLFQFDPRPTTSMKIVIVIPPKAG